MAECLEFREFMRVVNTRKLAMADVCTRTGDAFSEFSI